MPNSDLVASRYIAPKLVPEIDVIRMILIVC